MNQKKKRKRSPRNIKRRRYVISCTIEFIIKQQHIHIVKGNEKRKEKREEKQKVIKEF
jgi:hypothetical protein